LIPTGVTLLVASWILSGLDISPWWTAFLVAAVLAAADAERLSQGWIGVARTASAPHRRPPAESHI
jgi:hypothetical protein